jgi:SLOG cluster2
MITLDLRVAISVSEPGTPELEARGLVQAHVKHAFVETARQILAAGGSLAYGGDLRQGGFSEILVALLHTYSGDDRPKTDRIRLYLGQPVWKPMAAAQMSKLTPVLTRVKVPGAETDRTGRAAAALDFTAMRERQVAETDARVLVGGRLSGQAGRWPGVAEEAFLSLRAGQPVFLAGGMGGAADRVARALHGDWPEEFTEAYQLEHTTHYAELLDAGVGVPEAELRSAFEGAKLDNGLTPDENDVLFRTVDLDLMVALILRGLASVAERRDEAGR